MEAAERDGASVLAQILADKGTISIADLARVQNTVPQDRLTLLTSILQDKGLLSGADMAKLSPAAASTASLSAVSSTPAATPALSVVTKGSEPPIGRPSTTAALDGSFKTGKRIPVSIYGTLLYNSGFNTTGGNIEDIPLFANKQGSDPTGGDKNFYSTLRQTRIGVTLNPIDAAGGKLSGAFEFDMFGGQTPLPPGITMNLFRMRLAYGRLDWKNWVLEVGQDYTVFAPLSPMTFASYGIPGFTGSGNLWSRSPQIRIENKRTSGANTFYWQASVSDPNQGDYNTTVFSTARQPGTGERGRIPAFDNRFAFSRVHNERRYTVGLSGHYGRGKNAGFVGNLNLQPGIDSWGVALDYSLPFNKKFSLVGEAYEGRALGFFGGALGEAVGAVGTTGEHGVETRGGWIQAQTSFNKQWQLNLGYGLDVPNASQLSVGSRNRNQNYMGNLIYKATVNIGLALEYRRLITDFRNQLSANERGDHVDLAILYTF